MTDQIINTLINKEDLKQKSVVGVLALTSRTFILQLISLFSTFILTVLLDPATFGIFYVVSAVINFMNYFSDIGLAAALIQKNEEPTDRDLYTTFTIQQLLILIMIVGVFITAPAIAQFFKFGSGGLFLLRALAIAFLLSSLKTIPSVLLERKMEFDRLVLPQIIETLVFYAVAIFLAFKGAGVTSFAWAALARGVAGTVLLYILVPWKPQVVLDIHSAKKLLSYGIPYQANSFLALIKDDLLTVFLGKMLPFQAVGYIGWAKKWAEVALRLIMDNVIRVTFPAYSRLQHDSNLLSKAIQRSLMLLALLTLPVALGMILTIGPLLKIVPRYSKWEPALASFYIFTITAVFASLSSPLVNALNAIGKVKYTFYLMVMWATLTWILVPVGIGLFGFNGVAIAQLFIGITSFLPILFLRKIVHFSVFPQINKPLFAVCGMVIVVTSVIFKVNDPGLKLLIGIPSGVVVYAFIVIVTMRDDILPYIELVYKKTTHTS